MAAPQWYTDAGSLGTYPAGQALLIKLIALPTAPSASINFRLLSGSLPAGENIALSPDGYITGVPSNVQNQTDYVFTVRTNDEHTNIKDRTFSITLVGSTAPKFTTLPGELVNVVDSTYVDYQLAYDNKMQNNEVYFTLASGVLPPGLILTDAGKIIGYPKPPKLSNGSATTTTYSFVVQLNSNLGSDTATYQITIRNQRLNKPPNTRIPTILNYKPLVYPVPKTDLMYDYYLIDSPVIPDIESGKYFAFRVIGHDFDNQTLIYNYNGLPNGLVGDRYTGWITGTPIIPATGLQKFTFSVTVAKESSPRIVSTSQEFSLAITNDASQDISWVTPADLGTIFNGTISELFVQATSKQELLYRVMDGRLPPNLTFLSNGQLIGRVSNQPTSRMLREGESSTFTFSIMAFSPAYPLIQNIRTFTLNVYQYYPKPLETIYFTGNSSIPGRKIIQSLLTDETLIPTEYLYRSQDDYFGKAETVKFVHAYGVTSSTVDQYITAMGTNHYVRQITLGPLKTAIARDADNNIVYEVVYSEVIDDLTNAEGNSPPQTITWPRNIELRNGPWKINNTDLRTSYATLSTNLSPGRVREVHPGSLKNMRTQITSALGQDTDVNLLPKWMSSQQRDGNTIGFIQAWVLCYTLPDKSEIIKSNIVNNWAHSLNELQMTLDRYVVDKSASYNWNTNVTIPAWSELPSASPAPDPIESKDIAIPFPRKTILPKDLDY